MRGALGTADVFILPWLAQRSSRHNITQHKGRQPSGVFQVKPVYTYRAKAAGAKRVPCEAHAQCLYARSAADHRSQSAWREGQAAGREHDPAIFADLLFSYDKTSFIKPIFQGSCEGKR